LKKHSELSNESKPKNKLRTLRDLVHAAVESEKPKAKP
jgi:hypothetical protein